MEYADLWNNLVGVVRAIKLTDILDIGIIAVLIYSGIKLLRETRVSQLVKGILVLAAFYLLSSLLQLTTVSFVLQNIFSFGVFALFIVFQPEIRRALARVGTTRLGFLRIFSVGDDGKLRERRGATVEAVVSSADYFSRTRTGALIVFERQFSLSDIARTGTYLDAELSPQLLGNIFFKNAPLHDGALLIREDRCLAAGCLLPLSDSEKLSKHLGTRHRAALGISETSDAVVVVVSEETGAISVSEGGSLRRRLDCEALRALLSELLITDLPESDRGSSPFRRGKA